MYLSVSPQNVEENPFLCSVAKLSNGAENSDRCLGAPLHVYTIPVGSKIIEGQKALMHRGDSPFWEFGDEAINGAEFRNLKADRGPTTVWIIKFSCRGKAIVNAHSWLGALPILIFSIGSEAIVNAQ